MSTLSALAPRRGQRPLDGFVAALDPLMSVAIDSRAQAVAVTLEPWLARQDLLDGCDCMPCPDRYARRLVHADPTGRFTVLALIWSPGQASPIHAHKTWCALGVHSGALSESFFQAPCGATRTHYLSTRPRCTGTSSHGAADPSLIHQIANRGDGPAVSIHVYGVGLDAIECGVNQIHA